MVEGHVISYLWQDQRPTLQILSSNEIHKVCLDEYSHISIKVDKERRCVGTYIDGEYRACPHNSLTQSTDRCPECTYEQFFRNCDILNVEHLKQGKNCIFHPLCSKEELNSLKKDILCCKIHVVYLAVFGDVLKIGITQNKRLYQRMIEQGADAFVPVLSARNRAEAREIENTISKDMGFPQRMTGNEICNTLTNYDEQKADSLLLDCAVKICKSKGLPIPNFKVIKLDNKYPMPELINNPIFTREMEFKGDIVGIKGRLLIYENYGSPQCSLDNSKMTFALDLSKLVGRNINMSGELINHNQEDHGSIY